LIRRTASLIFRFSEIEQPVGNVDFRLWNSDYMAVSGRRQDFVVKNDVTHSVFLSGIVPMSWFAKRAKISKMGVVWEDDAPGASLVTAIESAASRERGDYVARADRHL
jgi:hypothetical protein